MLNVNANRFVIVTLLVNPPDDFLRQDEQNGPDSCARHPDNHVNPVKNCGL